MTATIDTDTVLRAYVKCALWSTNADHLDPEGTGCAGALQDHFGMKDVAPEALASMREDIASFVAANAADCALWVEALGEEQIGHDLWLTRNGHGAGFWDRFSGHPLEVVGDRLTAEAKPYGESYVYAGDDGRLYVS